MARKITCPNCGKRGSGIKRHLATCPPRSDGRRVISSAGTERLRGFDVIRADVSLHERIALALGWSLAETQSVPYPGLRDLVRPVSAALAEEISEVLNLGGHVKGPRPSARPPADRLPTVAQFGGGKLGMHAIKAPSGRWVLRGSVPAHLSYVQTDGSPITDEQAAGIRQAGPGFVSGIRTVTFASEAEALAAAARPAPAPRPSPGGDTSVGWGNPYLIENNTMRRVARVNYSDGSFAILEVLTSNAAPDGAAEWSVYLEHADRYLQPKRLGSGNAASSKAARDAAEAVTP